MKEPLTQSELSRFLHAQAIGFVRDKRQEREMAAVHGPDWKERVHPIKTVRSQDAWDTALKNAKPERWDP